MKLLFRFCKENKVYSVKAPSIYFIYANILGMHFNMCENTCIIYTYMHILTYIYIIFYSPRFIFKYRMDEKENSLWLLVPDTGQPRG